MHEGNHWFYKIFASVDLAGSTAFKASSSKGLNPSWVKTFDEFFHDFPSRLINSYSEIRCQRHPVTEALMKFRVWKFVGDEIVFQADLLNHKDAALHVLALKAALARYEEEGLKDKPLSLKATMWGAGFPVMNAQVSIPMDAEGGTVVDYLGPSIDLGFRLAKYADGRRIPVSVDLASILVDARQSLRLGKKLSILYEKSEPLKGVINNKPYPILWVDRLDEELTPEDEVLGLNRKCEHEALNRFIEKTIDDSGDQITSPFIVSDPAPEYSSVPGKFTAALDNYLSLDTSYSLQEDVPEGEDSDESRDLPDIEPLKSKFKKNKK